MGDHFHSKYVKMYGESGHFLKARMNWVVGLIIFQAFSTRCDQPLNKSFPPPLMSTSFPLFFCIWLLRLCTINYRHIKPIVKGLDQARYWQETPLQTWANIAGLCKLYNNVLRSRRLPRIEQNRTVFSRRPTHPKHLRSRVNEGKCLRKRYSSIKMRWQWRTGTSAHFLRR